MKKAKAILVIFLLVATALAACVPATPKPAPTQTPEVILTPIPETPEIPENQFPHSDVYLLPEAGGDWKCLLADESSLQKEGIKDTTQIKDQLAQGEAYLLTNWQLQVLTKLII
ncbi:MAG: hypothetical protein NUW24_11215 [Anaerolineae bacterium]|jgi:hypothetical protein|nr:hypothetical protein [Anaerolineae bacterium]MDH7472604.1 hypothetical protein [Anaerolineae bacterium]